MVALTVVLCILEILIQGHYLYQFNKKKDLKAWNYFEGFNDSSYLVAVLSSWLIMGNAYSFKGAFYVLSTFHFLQKNTYDLKPLYTGTIICLIFVIINSVLLAMGHKIRNKIKKNAEIRFNLRGLATRTLVFIGAILFVLISAKVEFASSSKQDREELINNLTKVYGNGNFRIVDINKVYQDYGFVGYNYTIKTSYMNKKFFVMSYENMPKHFYRDNFLLVYASNKYNLKYKLSYNIFTGVVTEDFSNLINRYNKLTPYEYDKDDYELTFPYLINNPNSNAITIGLDEYLKNYETSLKNGTYE